MIPLIFVFLLSYLIGAVPTSIIAGKLLKGIDIREHGSGNAGATNVLRVMGWKAGVAVLLIDIAKGFVATFFISRIGYDLLPIDNSIIQILAGLTAVFGHIWTVFARFKGGKGVAAAAGMLLGLAPATTAVCLVIFIAVVLSTRYVSLSSILAAVTLSVIMIVRAYVLNQNVPPPLLYFSVFVTLLILYTHRSNIKRLLNGTENKFSRSKN